MVEKKVIGTYDGTDVYEFTISSGNLTVNIMEYGATIHNIFFAGVDCVAGYDGLEGYINGGSYQGSTVGRYANRLGGAGFEIGGVKYNVDKNDNDVNSLHGGDCGFSHRLYKGETISDSAVKFTITSPDGEGGYPGNLTMSVTFSIENDTLSLKYDAVSDKDTVMNFTNHAYFNLGAKDNSTTVLQIKSDAITPVDKLLIPTGELMEVTDTEFDFRQAKPIGRDIGGGHEQLKLGGGYDHNFVLGDKKEYKKDVITAFCPESGITLTCSTDLPGVQLYTSNVLDEPVGKNGKPLTKYYAFCLETQFWPDTPNHASFPSCLVKAGERFGSVTEYAFKK